VTLLEVRNLETTFFTQRGKLRAVDNVSFALNEGETLGIVGETGSGKSVTAMSLLRLVSPPGRITGGQILFEGEDLLKKSDRQMRRIRGRQISMIFQEVMTSLNPAYTVGDQISEVFQVHMHDSKSVAERKAVESLAAVRIPSPQDMVRRYPHELSGGMRQRVMIAIALACRPKLLIADEPTTALDVTIQAQILDLINDMRDQLKMAMIFISHDLGVVARVADRIAVMYAGRIVELGDKYQMFDANLHPYTAGLLEAIPRAGARHQPLRPVPGQVPDLLQLPPGCAFSPRCPRAQPLCEQETPALIERSPLHWAACHFPGNKPAVVEMSA
jgi:oligopeptide/dipeptide ABC transporter ATP-binding protein